MIYIRVNSENMITFIHRKPFDPVTGLNETKEELLKTGFLIEDMPAPNTPIGNRAVAYYNPELKQVYYKYTAAPLSVKDRLDLLEGVVNAQLINAISKEEKNNGDNEENS